MRRNVMTIIEAYERCLNVAEDGLKYAIERNNEWNIEHNTNSIKIIKAELEIVNERKSKRFNKKKPLGQVKEGV